MSNAKKFFEEIVKSEEAKAILKSIEKPETKEDAIKVYVMIAEKLNVQLTEQEITEYLEKKTTDTKVMGKMDEEELSQVAGGAGHSDCTWTFKDYEDCFFIDACDGLIQQYKDYKCFVAQSDSIYNKNCQ